MARGSIHKQASGHWRAFYRDAGGRQVTKTLQTKRDAEEWIKEQIRVGADLDNSRAALMSMQELFEEVHRARRFAPATIAVHGAAWKHVPTSMRVAPISAVDAAAVGRVLATVKGPAMREKVRATLSMLFSWAIEERRLRTNPAKASGIRKTRDERLEVATSKDVKRYLTTDELSRLVAEIPPEYRCMIRMMAYVGLRPGEAAAVVVEQFGTDGTLTIDRSIAGPTKTGETRIITLPKIVAEWTIEHIETFVETRWDDPSARLFGAVDASNFRRRVFVPAVRRAQIRELRVNDLRHTAVSFAVSRGASVYDVQSMVGHSKPSITLDVYGELWDEGRTRLAEQLDEAIRASMTGAD